MADSKDAHEDRPQWEVFNPELSTWPLLEDARDRSDWPTDGEEPEPTEPVKSAKSARRAPAKTAGKPASSTTPQSASAAKSTKTAKRASKSATKPARAATSAQTPGADSLFSRATVGRRAVLGGVIGVAAITAAIAYEGSRGNSTRPVPKPAGLPPENPDRVLKSAAGFLPLQVGGRERAITADIDPHTAIADRAEYVNLWAIDGPAFDFSVLNSSIPFEQREREYLGSNTSAAWRTGSVLLRGFRTNGQDYYEVWAPLADGKMLSGRSRRYGDEAPNPVALVSFAHELLDQLPTQAPEQPTRPTVSWPTDMPVWREARFPDQVEEWVAIERREDPDSSSYRASYRHPDGRRLSCVLRGMPRATNRAGLALKARGEVAESRPLDQGVLYRHTRPAHNGSVRWVAQQVINQGMAEVQGDSPIVGDFIGKLVRALR